jgi:hypothetical protein
VYHADQAINEVFELFRVPLDRSHPPWRLNAPLAAGRSIPVSDSTGDSWLISPDGARVVYRADARTNDVFELFSVQLDRRRHVRRVDAPRPLARLSRSLIAGGDVEGFRITPDGTTVVYRADQVVDQRFELYRVPTDGSAPPVRVSSNLGMTGSIESRFEVSTDGTRVLYRADPRVNGRIELWSVPLAGGTAIPLNAPLPSSGDVHDFVIAPGSERAVYLSAVSSIASQELFGVPLDGSQPAVQLSTTPAFRSLIPSFRITPRGDSVVYLSDQIVDERFELFAVPIDGTRSPVPVSGGLASGGDVVAFELTPDGNRVVYRADESADERFELFLAYLTPRYRRR